MELTFKVDDNLLKSLIGNKEITLPFVPFECKGASGKSELVTSFLKVVRFMDKEGSNQESYILCPRLKGYFDQSPVCFEKGMDDVKPSDEWTSEYHKRLKASKKCPYYNPK